MNILHQHYISLAETYLGAKPNMSRPLMYLHTTPEIIDIHIGELLAARNRLKSFQENRSSVNLGLCLNAQYLINNLVDDIFLPEWDELSQLLLADSIDNPSLDLHLTFQEINISYDFLDQEKVTLNLLGTLFIAFYRTYTLISNPPLRSANVQIGSSLEEMLALLAIDDCPTLLFKAVKQWILDYENEGFSRELALRVRNL